MLILLRISMLTYIKCIQDFNLVTVIVNQYNNSESSWNLFIQNLAYTKRKLEYQNEELGLTSAEA